MPLLTKPPGTMPYIVQRIPTYGDRNPYAINDDIARLVVVGLLMLVMPLYFHGKCKFGLKDGNWKLGLCLALPE